MDASTTEAPSEPRRNHDIIASNAAERLRKMEEKLFSALGAAVLSSEDLEFMIVTRDTVGDLLYAPVSSRSAAGWAKVLDSGEVSLLSTIRNLLVQPEGPRNVTDEILEMLAGDRSAEAVAIQITSDGKVASIHVEPPGSDQDGLWRAFEGQPIGERVQKFAARFKELCELPLDKPIGWIARRGAEMDDNVSGREFALYQNGFISLVEPEQMADILRLCQISDYACLSVLTERERYFEKAVRQCVRGEILKSGFDEAKLKGEVARLRQLRKDERFHVPHVTGDWEKDEDGNGASPGWYRMQRFTLPTLLDVLTSVPGYQRFEVASMVRRCLNHLKETYWFSVEVDHDAGHSNALVGPLVLAVIRAQELQRNFDVRTKQILEGKPVRVRLSVNLYDRESLRGLESVAEATAQLGSTLRVKFKWDSSESDLKECRHPAAVLNEVCSSWIQKGGDGGILRTDVKGRPHGDAHFANIMIDASIPEDPLVVSIDQSQELQFGDCDTLCDACSDLLPELHRNVLETSLQKLKLDPMYDVAKMLMSAACCYGLAYRRGFSIAAVQAGTGVPVIELKRRGERVSELLEQGGISGAKLVHFDAPVELLSLKYHADAARVIVEWVREQMASAGLGENARKTSLMRLWLLTVRHGLSIADLLYPRQVVAALIMYCQVAVFVNSGAEVVGAGIRDPEGVLEDDLAQALQKGVIELGREPPTKKPAPA